MLTLSTGWFTPAETVSEPASPVMLMPAGILWDALRTPVTLGMPALERLRNNPDDKRLLGPVLWDRTLGRLYWLIVRGASNTYPPPAKLLTAGTWVGAPSMANACLRRACWVHLPSHPILTGPAWLAHSLTNPHDLENTVTSDQPQPLTDAETKELAELMRAAGGGRLNHKNFERAAELNTRQAATQPATPQR